MMPSIGASFADSTSQAAGGSPIFAPVHSLGRGNRVDSRNTTSWTPTTTSEATARTDMGGDGLLAGLDGGGGLGIGGLISGTVGSLIGGRKPTATGTAAQGAVEATTGGNGPSWWLWAALGGVGLLVVGLLVFMGKE